MNLPHLITYLETLSRNNNKAWFEPHRADYEALRVEFTVLVEDVIFRIGEFDPKVLRIEAKDCLFRINRDLRFSKDKRPYKTTFSAAICDLGRNSGQPVYYFHVDEKGALMQAAGVHLPQPETLGRIRNYIANQPEELEAIIRTESFEREFGKIDGPRLKRSPAGFPADSPFIDELKLTSFTLGRDLDVRTIADEELPGQLVEGFRGMYPFVNWLRAAVA